MLYPLVRPLLFAIDPELAHDLGLELLQRFHRLLPDRRIDKPVRVMGLEFPNPVGLAAGLDKNADYLDGLATLGFGFIETGSVTPKPQPGNPKPRVFRLSRHHSLINRMGFNNKGIDYLLERVGDKKRDYVLGINIGKNLSTPVEQALSDYRIGLEKVYSRADYVTINISSPNTPGLRDLQNEDALEALLAGIAQLRRELEDRHQYRRPLALKLSPDLDPGTIPGIAQILRKYGIDGLIATNTTVARDGVKDLALAAETGGLSGAALRDRSRQILSAFYEELGDDIPIISVGGIDSVEEAKMRFELGARLIQLYTGLIYQGPGLVSAISRSL
ncbi:MAG: quinone-dependent dihydroorotate dehydrogenase [Gammaproteobacteria bacterium]|nr:quinone-dependent dihydroorotate dehydrogenase [Gammaproteobacteria bacterium]MDH3534198.1 quinone-dependent dihydroorotate dehydrogenase [Gammaproteobacteria bacterium]